MVVKKTVVGFLLAAASWMVSAEVNVNSVLGEAAMWLDASSPANFTFDERGGVVSWRNLGAGRATYGDALSYKTVERSLTATLNTTTNTAVRGSVESIFGAPGLEFGVVGNECDYQYTRITTIRTVFFVGRLDAGVDTTYYLAPILGDKTSCHFHRNKTHALWWRECADDGDKRDVVMTFYKNSATTTCNGETTMPSYTSRDIIIIEAAQNVESDSLGMDRKAWQRTSGRGINELLIFTRVLTAEERTAVYNYLDAKWNQGGWDTGTYEKLSAYGGPDKATFAASTTVGAADDPARRVLTAQYEVAEGATATFNCPVYGGGLTFTGGGKLEFAGGGVFHGKFVQQGGTLNLGGGTLDIRASSRNNDAGGIPQLTGNITWENGTVMPDYWTEFRPQEGANITLAKGAGIYKHSNWRTFLDKGVTLTLAEDAGLSDIGGPFIVTCDYKTDNYLNIHGGTLVVTNANDNASSGADVMQYSITIGTQLKAGRAFMDMDGGRVVTRRLRVAASWGNETTGVSSTGTVNLGGGTVELLDCLALGNNSGTRALATVNLNGGEMISPNGILMYNDDQDILTFNGTVVKANADCAKYLDLRKGSGANVTLGAGGLPFEVAADKTVALGWGLTGPGGIAKRGAGTLVLDQDATFLGGVQVQAGTLKAKTVDAMGTGTLSVAAGATVELLLGARVSLAADCAGAIKVTLAQGGKQPVANVESGFAVANVQLFAYDEIGNLVEGAVFTVENGVLYVNVGGDFTATAASAGGTWFSLPWKRDGAAASYPTTAGQVMKATITATGKSQVSMSANATAGRLVMVNGDVNPVFTLSGPNSLSANLDLGNYVGEFAVPGMDVLRGVVTMGNTSWFTYIVPAGEEQMLGDSTVTFANSLGVLQKSGAGRLVNTGIMNRSLLVNEGVFTMLIDEPVSTGALNLTGDGLKEKGGTNTLTITGGTFGGPFAVTAGQLTVNGSILGMSSLYIGEGAKVYIPHCNQVNNRLPSNGQVVVDGGELHVCGVNPFSGNCPEIWLTNGMLRVDCATGSEHIKFKNVHMKDSTFRLQGTKAAYANNGIFYFSNSGQFFLDGDCRFEAAAGIPNAIEGEAAISVNVSAGSSVVWGTPFMRDITKMGPGSVQFADTVDQAKCTATFVMREGVLLTGSKVPRLSLSAGTTVKPLGGDPLTITTTLTLPATGTITVDLSAIDFSTREEAVRIFTYGQFKESDLAKFAFPALPEDWRVTVGAGLQIVKTSLPKNISWDTGSGEWGDHLWNQDPAGYAAEGYHNVTFKDSTNAVAGAATEIDVSGARIVTGFTFNAETTPYIFSGAGSLTMPSFNGGQAGGGFEINVPLTLLTGGITFAKSPYNQTIGDIRGTLGAINVPASTGGEVKLNFTNASPRNPGAITLGQGKTLEICANFTSPNTSIIPTGAVTGDATTKLRVTAKDSTGHMDLTTNNPDFRGKVEVADGAFLYVDSQLNNVVATEQNPVWVHGEGSIFSVYGKQTNNRFPPNGWGLVEDGGQFYYRGVNPCGQANSPSLIVSNGTIKVEMVSGSHLHLKNLRFFGNNEVFITGSAAAYANEGLNIFGSVTVKSGTTKFYRTGGATSKFRFVNSNNIAVEDGALLQLGGAWVNAPIKAGEGKVELLDELDVPGNAFNVAGGLIVANGRANLLSSLTLASGCGFDLTVPESCYAPTNSATFTASGKIRLVTGVRELTKGEYLLRWEPGHAPNCLYRLVADQPMGSFFTLERASDGVRVAVRNFAILVR